MCDGAVVLDKPPGITSSDVVIVIKNILNVKKASHAGTLDPNVSGVLLILLGNACKLTNILQKMEKEYVGVLHLHKDVEKKDVIEIFSMFTGTIIQTPPVRSAVTKKPRKRRIEKLELLEQLGRDVVFNIVCESGTYVRKLCAEIGEKLGGGHMTELRRIRVGSFTEDEAIRLEEVYKKGKHVMIGMNEITRDIKKIFIKPSACRTILNGSPLYKPGISKIENPQKGEPIILMLRDIPIAIAKYIGESVVAKTDRIIVNPKKFKTF